MPKYYGQVGNGDIYTRPAVGSWTLTAIGAKAGNASTNSIWDIEIQNNKIYVLKDTGLYKASLTSDLTSTLSWSLISSSINANASSGAAQDRLKSLAISDDEQYIAVSGTSINPNTNFSLSKNGGSTVTYSITALGQIWDDTDRSSSRWPHLFISGTTLYAYGPSSQNTAGQQYVSGQYGARFYAIDLTNNNIIYSTILDTTDSQNYTNMIVLKGQGENNSDLIYCTSAFGIYRSVNGGSSFVKVKSWTVSVTESSTTYNTSSVAGKLVNAIGNRLFYVDYWTTGNQKYAKILESIDKGTTWRPSVTLQYNNGSSSWGPSPDSILGLQLIDENNFLVRTTNSSLNSTLFLYTFSSDRTSVTSSTITDSANGMTSKVLAFPDNTAPSNISLTYSVGSGVPENSAIGTTVGTFSAVDAEGGAMTYSISGTDASSFTLSGSTLKTAAVFNYEAKSSYSISVTATDSGGLSYTKAITVDVTNINEAPPAILLSNNSIEEEKPIGSLVGVLSATDPEGDAITFSIVSGGDKFQISGSQLQSKVVFDREAPGAASSYAVTVRATSANGGAYVDQSFIIAITAVDESPVGFSLSNSSIREEKPAGTLIGLLSATDPEGTAISYSITSGGDKFQISGNQLQSKVPFDRDAAGAPASYSVTVRATDATGAYAEQSFTISVNEWAADNPVTMSLNPALGLSFIVAESQSDPKGGFIKMANGAALPFGSVIKFDGAKHMKQANVSAAGFDKIEPIAKDKWKWSAAAKARWVILSTMWLTNLENPV